MNELKKLEQLAKTNLTQFGLVMHDVHPNTWGARCVLQLQYAYKLSESEGNAYDKLVLDAINLAWDEAQAEGAITAATTKAVETMLAPLAAKAKSYSLLCVGHAHIDMNWMWGYDETASITLDTFRTMLDLMNEYPEFTFGQSQASVYRIVEQHCPAMLEEIKRRVHEGRWEVTASTWVEADRNMPNLESMARHFLYTKQYLSNLLDIDPATLNIDYEPDTFGHNINVPEVLCDGGVKYYYHCRGFDKHVLYNWKAPSGRQILVFREPTWYNWTMDGRCALVVPEFCKSNGLNAMLRVYGVGDHGGGPTRRDIEKIIEMNQWPIFPTFKFSTYGEFYRLAEQNRAALPIVEGELNFIFDGCYTTQTRQKKGNRLGEALLAEAEGAAALAKQAIGSPYDTKTFTGAWEKVLFNQFHDILPGSGTVNTREYAMGQYQEAFTAANTSRSLTVRALSDASDTSAFAVEEDISLARSEGAGVGFGLSEGRIAQVGRHAGLRRLFTVYNPLPTEREELAEISLWDWSGDVKRMQWTDASGKKLAHQVISNGFNDYWGHQHAEVLVKAAVPPMGYTTVILDEASPATFGLEEIGPRVDSPYSGVLENEFIRAELDIHDGGLVSLVDKQTGTEYVKPGCPMGIFRLVEEDTIRGMSAWTVGRYMNVHNLNQGVKFKDAKLGAQYIRQSATYEAGFGNGSKLIVTVSLANGEKLLRFDTTVRWQEIGTAETFFPQINFHMPVAYDYSTIRYDVPMGTIDREPIEMDVPAQSFGMPVNPNGDSLMLISDSKYGYRGLPRSLSLTLIRSSVEPDPWPEVGEHRIQIAIALCSGCKEAETALASAFSRKFIVAAARAHKGTLPPTFSMLKLSGGIALSAVKQAEDGSGIIVRYYELNGKSAQGTIELAAEPKSAAAVSVLEQPVGGTVAIDGKTVRFDTRPYGVGSVLIKF
jgi:alpha-mannosidase